MNVDNLPFQLAVAIIQRMTIFVAHVSEAPLRARNLYKRIRRHVKLILVPRGRAPFGQHQELRPKGSRPLGTGMRIAKKAVRLLTITCDVVVVIGVKQRGIRIVIRRRKVRFGHPESEKRYVYIAIYCLPRRI